MTTKAKIKIVKKKDVLAVEKAEINESKETKETARKMVTNVSSWVNDFQKRKRDETKQAFEKLLPKTPQTDGV
ncbi:MAG: hypothetical protein ACR2J3_09155 [Aridibacter sp.]